MADEFDEFLARHLKKYLSKDEKYYAPLEQNTTVYNSRQPYTYNSGAPAKIGETYYSLLNNPAEMANFPAFTAVLRDNDLLVRGKKGEELVLNPDRWHERATIAAAKIFFEGEGKNGRPPGPDDVITLGKVEVHLGLRLAYLNKHPSEWHNHQALATELLRQRGLLIKRGEHTPAWDINVGIPQIAAAMDVRQARANGTVSSPTFAVLYPDQATIAQSHRRGVSAAAETPSVARPMNHPGSRGPQGVPVVQAVPPRAQQNSHQP